MTKLSEHFDISEFEYSETAIRNNIPNIMGDKELTNAVNLCVQVLEPIRNMYGSAIKFNSGYRCPNVNKLAGGVSNSAHVTGQAADIIPVDMITLPDDIKKSKLWNLFLHIRDKNLPVDQVIFEFGHWIHIGISNNIRHQYMTASWVNGKKTYNLL